MNKIVWFQLKIGQKKFHSKHINKNKNSFPHRDKSVKIIPYENMCLDPFGWRFF